MGGGRGRGGDGGELASVSVLWWRRRRWWWEVVEVVGGVVWCGVVWCTHTNIPMLAGWPSAVPRTRSYNQPGLRPRCVLRPGDSRDRAATWLSNNISPSQ